MLQFAESNMYYVTFYMALRTQGQFEFETSAFTLPQSIVYIYFISGQFSINLTAISIAFFHLRGCFNFYIFLHKLFPDFVPDSCKRQLGVDKCCRKFDRPFRKPENNFVDNPRDILFLNMRLKVLKMFKSYKMYNIIYLQAVVYIDR